MTLLLMLAMLIWSALPVWSASCTFGTDCYCDKVVPVGGAYYDSALLFCEDFEAPTLTSNTGAGVTSASARGSGGTNAYGPWYDDTGYTNNRGHNSYWNKKYGDGVTGFLWASGTPASPVNGPSCGFTHCTGMKVWHPTNLFEANSLTPRAAFMTQDSDFSAEVGTLTAPTNVAGGSGDGVFDGSANFAFRIPVGNVNGIAGGSNFTSGTTEIGLTMAVAYPTNSLTSGVWGTDGVAAAWKHNEWGTVNAPNCGFDGLFIFYNQRGPRSGIPFAGFIGAFQSGCTGGGYSGSIIDETAGNAEATADAVMWNTPTNYDQPTDWPFGTWGCVRGHLLIGSTTERMRVWFQGPYMTSERLLIDVTFTKAGLDNVGGYNHMKWNAYANTNQGGGYVPTSALTFRYEDNVHARAGEPVSCAQIGFTGGGSGGGRRFSPQFNLRRAELPPAHVVHVSDVRKEDEEMN